MTFGCGRCRFVVRKAVRKRPGSWQSPQAGNKDEEAPQGGPWFVVKEKPVVRKVLIAGLKQVPLSDVEVLTWKKVQFYDPKQVEENRLKIKEVMDDAGLYLAQVRQDVKIKGRGAEIWYRVQENARIGVRQIDFVGNRAVSDQALRDVMLTKVGGVFSSGRRHFRADAFQRDVLLIQGAYYDRGYEYRPG